MQRGRLDQIIRKKFNIKPLRTSVRTELRNQEHELLQAVYTLKEYYLTSGHNANRLRVPRRNGTNKITKTKHT